MRKSNNWLLILCINMFLLASFSLAIAQDGKMPITTSSDEARNSYLHGLNLTDKLRFQEARQFFENAVKADPNFALAYLNLGFTLPSAKEFFETFDKARALTDQISEGERLWILGVEAGNNGRPLVQREYYLRMVKLYPNDERAHNLLGNYYFGQQKYETAIEQYEEAKKINPEFSQIYNQMGYAYRFLNRYGKAETAFKKYVELIPDDPNPYDSYAELLMKMGQFEKSIENYRKALEVNPNFAASHSGIATNFNFLGRHDEARQQLKVFYDGALNDGQRRAAHFATAVSYMDQGNSDMALAELDKQYALADKINDPTNKAGDLGTMGTILLFIGKPDEALLKFKQAREEVVNSDRSDEIKRNARLGYLFNEARVAVAQKKFDTAKAKQVEYAMGAEANNNRFQIWASHQIAGIIALAEGEYDKAISEFQKANPQNTYNLYRIGLAYKGKGDKVNAHKWFETVANYNQLNSLNYSFVRTQAQKLVASK
ncbi:MAG: tetratricopeptide repeat protein [candidate division Zixibacteria bacterium]|nr:tetratricopeptide repeat protein [candidate division Zixibacteria bacterium]